MKKDCGKIQKCMRGGFILSSAILLAGFAYISSPMPRPTIDAHLTDFRAQLFPDKADTSEGQKIQKPLWASDLEQAFLSHFTVSASA